MKKFLFLIGCLILVGCNNSSGGSGGGTAVNNQSCNMDGTWTTCMTDNTDSQATTMVISGGAVNQTLTGYVGTTNCTGTPNAPINFSLTMSLGPAAQSPYLSGATDVAITPQGGMNMGCGAGTVTYTIIQFSASCTQFQVGELDCVQANVTGPLGPTIYTKQ